MCTNGNRFFSQSRNSAAMCTLQARRGSRGLFPTHDPSKTQKLLFKFNSHQSAPPQLFIYFRGCELAAPPKNNIFAAWYIVRTVYGIFGREITKYTVIYGVYIQFWPTLPISNRCSTRCGIVWCSAMLPHTVACRFILCIILTLSCCNSYNLDFNSTTHLRLIIASLSSALSWHTSCMVHVQKVAGLREDPSR